MTDDRSLQKTHIQINLSPASQRIIYRPLRKKCHASPTPFLQHGLD